VSPQSWGTPSSPIIRGSRKRERELRFSGLEGSEWGVSATALRAWLERWARGLCESARLCPLPRLEVANRCIHSLCTKKGLSLTYSGSWKTSLNHLMEGSSSLKPPQRPSLVPDPARALIHRTACQPWAGLVGTRVDCCEGSASAKSWQTTRTWRTAMAPLAPPSASPSRPVATQQPISRHRGKWPSTRAQTMPKQQPEVWRLRAPRVTP
jgi:hypothetical protein